MTNCPFCNSPVQPEFFFCPICGKKLKIAPLSTSFISQLGIYALSFLLPPLGLWPAAKYLRDKNPTAKAVGFIAIFLTAASILISYYVVAGYLSQLSSSLGQLGI